MGGCCYREKDQVPPVPESQPKPSMPTKRPSILQASQPITSPSLPQSTTAHKFRRAVKTALVATNLRRSSHSHLKVQGESIVPVTKRASLQSTLPSRDSHTIKKLSDPFENHYQRSKETIAKATACQVYQADYLPTGQKCLVKQLNKRGTAKDMHENRHCATEAEVWMSISHPCLARVLEVVQDEHCFYVVCEACSGTLVAERRKAATEGWAACALFQVLSMLRAVHSEERLHLAIAPDTIWLTENQGNPELKVLSPPGLVHAKGKEFEQAAAPEKEKTERSDVWSCGIVLFFLLSSELPYTSNTYHQLLNNAHKPEIAFSYFWNHISPEAKSLVSRMLSAHPASRPSVQECLSDPWVASHHSSISTKVLDHTIKQLRTAHHITPVKAAVLNFLLARVMKNSDLAAYAQVFEALDTDGSGTLTPEELRVGLERLMPSASAAAEVTRIAATVQPGANGAISYHQFLLSAVDQHVLFSKENLRLAFAYFDSDHNGTISASELKASLFGNSPQSESLWKELSHRAALRDGVVTFREFENMVMAIS